MARWFTSLFFLIFLGGSVFSGTPLRDNCVKNEMYQMKCCNHKTESLTPQQADDIKLCQTLNCTTSAPTSPTSAQMRLVSLLVILKTSPIIQIFFATESKEKVQPFYAKTVFLKPFQPKYIQYHSFLI